MDFEFEQKWKSMLTEVERFAGQPVDLQAVLFLVGVQELGHGNRKFKKDEKVALMHIALCTLLEPEGFYSFLGLDEDGWPHFERTNKLPHLNPGEQELLVKRALIKYFEANPIPQ